MRHTSVVAVATSDLTTSIVSRMLDEVSRCLQIEVDLTRFESATVALEVGTVIDELHTIEQSFAAPPFAVLAAFDFSLAADRVGYQFECPRADRLCDRVSAAGVETAMDDQSRIVGEIRDDCDVRPLSISLTVWSSTLTIAPSLALPVLASISPRRAPPSNCRRHPCRTSVLC